MAPPTNSHLTTPEAEFLRSVLAQIDQTWGDVEPVYDLFRKNLDKLNEILLHELPDVFSELVAGQSKDKSRRTADIFIIFGVRISEFPLGNRALNLELSIAAYEAALQVRTRDTFPQDWAGTQNNLGNAYLYRIRGDRADNLERAIAAYEAALQVYTRDAFPQQWAGTQNNLGEALRQRIRGDRADNLERAIAAYEAALQVSTRDAFPQQWAQIHNNLGEALRQSIRGDRADNLERAIAAYEAALQVYTRDAFPQDWAMTQNNLGEALRQRIRGERANNLERAIAASEAALQVYTRDAFPDDWAWTQGNLISALLERSQLTGNADDLDTAIAALAEAGTVAIPGTDSYVWIQRTLGTALDYRFSLHKDPTDLRQAVTAYRRAADTTPWASDQTYYYEKAADSQYQLGVALTQDGQWYNGLAALEASHATYHEAHSRLGRADALQQMGRTHYLMSNFDKAGIYFRDALRIYTAEASLPGQAACHAGLGRLMLRLNFIDDAIAELHQACQLYTQLNDTARLSEVQQVYDLAQKVKAKQPLAATPSPPPHECFRRNF